MRPIISTIVISLFAAAALPAQAAGKKCKKVGKKSRVFVRAKTPLYRGPGMNYRVASFIEAGACATIEQVSMDRSWILVDLRGKLGWVERSRLSASSQSLVQKMGGDPAPSPSSTRAFATTKRNVPLMEGPSKEAQPRGLIPQGTKLLALAITPSLGWLQVRDTRGDVGWVETSAVEASNLDKLPRTSGGGFDKVVKCDPKDPKCNPPPPPPPIDIIEDPPPVPRTSRSGMTLSARVYAAALAPTHSLTSNGEAPVRNYDLSAFAGALGLEVRADDLGPFAARVGYQFGYLTGINPDGAPNVALSGFEQDAQARFGLPIAVGPLLIVPEIGYAFGQFKFDSQLPGTEGTVFVSSVTHAGIGGARFAYFASQDLLLELDGSFLFGTTSEAPQRLGVLTGSTIGALGGLGGQYFLSDSLGVIVRYAVNYRSTPFKGRAAFDDTISQATLTDLSHGLRVGVNMTF